VDNKHSLPTIVSTDVGFLVLFGVAVVLLHILVNGRYGFHRDELQSQRGGIGIVPKINPKSGNASREE
jgi:hypothetical protein